MFDQIQEGFIAETRPNCGPWFPSDRPVSHGAKSLLARMLRQEVKDRCTVEEALSHEWIVGSAPKEAIPAVVTRGLLYVTHQLLLSICINLVCVSVCLSSQFASTKNKLRLLVGEDQLRKLDTQRMKASKVHMF